MSEFLSVFWNSKEFGAMESCYKLYTWINHTILMLLLQIFWKMSQISDYFKEKPEEEAKPIPSLPTFSPLTKEYKFRRHIRSMSDVQSSTPYYRIPYAKSRKGSHPALFTYDSDTRARRIRQYRPEADSSDSSDCRYPRKPSIMEQNIMKHSDSMRIL